MIKPLVAGIWAILVLSGATYFFGMQNSDAGAGEDPKEQKKDVQHLPMLPMSIAVIREGSVVGYVILEASYTVDRGNLKTNVPVDVIMHDTINTALFNNPDIEPDFIGKFNLDGLRADIKSSINTKLGEEVVHDVFVQRIDFISSDDVRDRKLRGG